MGLWKKFVCNIGEDEEKEYRSQLNDEYCSFLYPVVASGNNKCIAKNAVVYPDNLPGVRCSIPPVLF